MEKYSLYLDESGNTWNDFSNQDQPFFINAGWLVPESNEEILKEAAKNFFDGLRSGLDNYEPKGSQFFNGKIDSTEAKFKEFYRHLFREFLSKDAIPITVIYQKSILKPRMLTNIILDPENNRFSNNFYYCLQVIIDQILLYCSEAELNEFHDLLNSLSKSSVKNNINDFKSQLKPIIDRIFIKINIYMIKCINIFINDIPFLDDMKKDMELFEALIDKIILDVKPPINFESSVSWKYREPEEKEVLISFLEEEVQKIPLLFRFDFLHIDKVYDECLKFFREINSNISNKRLKTNLSILHTVSTHLIENWSNFLIDDGSMIKGIYPDELWTDIPFKSLKTELNYPIYTGNNSKENDLILACDFLAGYFSQLFNKELTLKPLDGQYVPEIDFYAFNDMLNNRQCIIICEMAYFRKLAKLFDCTYLSDLNTGGV